MKRALLILGFLGLAGCDWAGIETTASDAGVDAGAVEAGPCTEWVCHVTCYDAGCTCVDVCTSHDPTICPGPWPCK
jgi:hypothetical protein